jgi:hypothetical protein
MVNYLDLDNINKAVFGQLFNLVAAAAVNIGDRVVTLATKRYQVR